MIILRLLGGASIEGPDGAQWTGPAAQPRRLALLAVLVAQGGEAISRERLAALLWPERAPDRARHLVADNLYVINKELEGEPIEAVGDGLRLNAGAVTSDVKRFESALSSGDPERAVELYGGPFLEGFFLRGSVEFDDWSRAERERLERLHRESLRALAESAPDTPTAVESWRRLVESDPYDARWRTGLMKALVRSGNRAGALAEARSHSALLAAEFDAEPDPSVEVLVERIREGSFSSEDPATADRDDVGEPPGDGVAGSDPAATSRLHPVASEPVEEGPRGRAGPVDRLSAGLSLRRGRAIAIAALVALALIAGFIAVGDLGTGAAGEYGAVAVLPLDNLSGDPDDEYFSDGITEDIITRLSKLGAFDVISRTSVMRYKDSNKPLREIGKELGVDAIVEGSVRRVGNRVRITAQLVDAQTAAHLWAETYDRELADVFAVQSEIAGRIAGALEEAFEIEGEDRLASVPTRDVEAYDFYLRARDEYGEYTDPANEQAIRLFRRAIDRDPEYAEAWAGLADAYGQEALRFAPGEASVWADSAIGAASRAIELAPDVAEGYKALGLAYYAAGRMEGSLQATREAVERNPGSHAAIANIGGSLMTTGRLDESLPWLRRARALDPLSVLIDLHLMEVYWRFQDDTRVDSLLSRAEQMHSGHPEVVGRRIKVDLGRGRTDRAIAVARTVDVASAPRFLRQIVGAARLVAGDAEGAASALEPFEFVPTVDTPQFEVSGPPSLALALRESGETDRAADLLDRLEADLRARTARNSRYSLRLDLARVLALQGELDEALEWFQRAVDTGFRNVRLARWDPTLEPLRGHDGFESALVDLDARIDAMRSRVEEARGS